MRHKGIVSGLDMEQIKANERMNTGHCILFYQSAKIGTWTAFGLSAYAAKLLADRDRMMYIEAWSLREYLPTVTVSGEVYHKMSSVNRVCNTAEMGLFIECPINFTFENFRSWSEGLRKLVTERNWKGADVDILVPDLKYIQDNMSAFSRNLKRVIDLCVSACCLLAFSWLIALIWYLVWREDHGPAIFSQERIGRFGRPFMIHKFRSMRLDAERMGPQLSHAGGENDPRLTRIGRFIRAHHLDELPQLWDVFVGNMAFIGPRPERKFYIDQIMERDPRYPLLYQIRPGVTSYATLYNGYTDTIEKMVRRLQLDLYYLEHRSLWLDAKILLNTFCSIVFGKKF